MKFSLMFFASDESTPGPGRYDLLLESARYADQHGFDSVWVPERHFTPLGDLYPNPAVLHAALARETSRIGLRAGSVVLPLHHPLRVAEEWAVVDNLSGGRVGVSFASGWNPGDFAFFPERYADRAKQTHEAIPVVQALWRGERIMVTNGTGAPERVRSYPRPVQPELPTWLTVASSPDGFTMAGRSGANLLTHLLDQGVDGLGEQIARYRRARADAGFDPDTGQVTVMLHTFLRQDAAQAKQIAREPYCRYIKGNIGLLRGLARSRSMDVDVTALPEAELTEFVSFLYERFASSRALIGSPESALPLVRRLGELGVDEVACLLDFGPTVQEVLTGLPVLNELRQMERGEGESEDTPATGLAAARARCTVELAAAEFFDRIESAGVQYGPAMRCLEQIWLGDGEALGRLRLPEQRGESVYEFHPALLDNAFLLLGALAPGAARGASSLTLPVGVRSFRSLRRPSGEVFSHVVRTVADFERGVLEADVEVLDGDGLVARAEGLRMRTVGLRETLAADVGELCLETRWREVTAPPPALVGGCWLVVGDPGGFGSELAAALGMAEVVGLDGLSAAVREMGPLAGIVLLRALETDDLEDAGPERMTAEQEAAVEAVVALLQACLQLDDSVRCGRLWLVTSGAQPVESAAGVAQAPLWGVGRVLAAEHPELWGGLVDLDPRARDAKALAAVLVGERTEDQLALRGGKLLAPRLLPAGARVGPTAPMRLDPTVSYLLTGGLGDLGLAMARRLVGRGARFLVLAGRNRPGPEALAFIAEADAAGALVLPVALDVADEAAVAGLPDLVKKEGMPPVGGVFHLAGVAHGAMLADTSPRLLREVARPKVAGGWNLHRVFAQVPLFVLVSAIPATVGAIGTGAANYAAANAFLDALAHYRRSHGAAGSAIGYGPWRQIGMAAREGGLARLEGMGVGSITTQEGLEILERVVEHDVVQLTVARLNWPELMQAFPSTRDVAQLAEFAAAVRPGAAARLARECLEASAEQRPAIIGGYLRERLAGVLHADHADLGDLDLDRPINGFGVDSLLALELRSRMESELGVVVPLVRLLEGPTLDELTQDIVDLLLERDSGSQSTEEFVF